MESLRVQALTRTVRDRQPWFRGRMLDGIDIETKDAINLVLPARTSCLEPCQYSWINSKLFIRIRGLFERRCWLPFVHTLV